MQLCYYDKKKKKLITQKFGFVLNKNWIKTDFSVNSALKCIVFYTEIKVC
jgi:hypothetical protein